MDMHSIFCHKSKQLSVLSDGIVRKNWNHGMAISQTLSERYLNLVLIRTLSVLTCDLTWCQFITECGKESDSVQIRFGSGSDKVRIAFE